MSSLSVQKKIERIAVTGDLNFLRQKRFSLLFEALAEHTQDVQLVPIDNLYDSKWLKKIAKDVISHVPLSVSTSGRASAIRKQASTFTKQSIKCERKVRSLKKPPSFVFHLFGMYCPSWHYSDFPFSMYLDYTMALAHRTWSPWAPFSKKEDLQAWQECEKIAYRKASCIFTFSQLVKQSLIEEYGISPHKIFPIGASGQFLNPYKGHKKFGSHKILFNGSDFERKGGDLVVPAFQKIKASVPEAELIIVGHELSLDKINQNGIHNMGMVSDPLAMQRIFLEADILLAPALCEPYGQILVEAMNYGLPTIISNVGGMPEIVDHDINGLILSEHSSECLAENVIALIQNQERLNYFSEQGRLKVREKLNWYSISSNICEQIEEALVK
ncbi:glycosyltransferase family 4 protein [Nodosilinea nodulosa]|uniref:glycosyltransferase family 4 protein n=1 Tax=Nodosilinea nodulosa TaxID=416001 RepID=UPI0003004E34|nr:glycosyltransferase family 4 protein [Nodosilinea nodulosa]